MRERLFRSRDHFNAAGLTGGALVPGAAQHFFSGALQTRDRSKRMNPNDPGAAARRLRGTASAVVPHIPNT
jgi:hypothetical protein